MCTPLALEALADRTPRRKASAATAVVNQTPTVQGQGSFGNRPYGLFAVQLS